MFRKNKAQSTLEYAVIIAVVAGALLAINKYMNRGIQGKLRESTDQIGEQYSAGNMASTVSTEQKGAMNTIESFGYDPVKMKQWAMGANRPVQEQGEDDAAYSARLKDYYDDLARDGLKQGASYYVVKQPAEVTQKTEGEGEKITKSLKTEKLFP